MEKQTDNQKHVSDERQTGAVDEKPPYQAPVVMPLGELARGQGQGCIPGSAPTSCSSGGSNAGPLCSQGSSNSGSTCGQGGGNSGGTCLNGNNNTAVTCDNGNQNFGGACINGGSAAY